MQNPDEIFDEEALTANRDGYMTKAQRKHLNAIREDVRFVQYMAVAIAIFVLLFITRSNLAPIQLTIAFIVVVLVFVILLFSLWDSRLASRDLHKGHVHSIEGRVEFSTKGMRGDSGLKYQYYMIIKEQEFLISKALYQAITEQHKRYFRVYYAPYSNTLLTMEPSGILYHSSQLVSDSQLEEDTQVPLEEKQALYGQNDSEE